jgi:hypothetical protein
MRYIYAQYQNAKIKKRNPSGSVFYPLPKIAKWGKN